MKLRRGCGEVVAKLWRSCGEVVAKLCEALTYSRHAGGSGAVDVLGKRVDIYRAQGTFFGLPTESRPTQVGLPHTTVHNLVWGWVPGLTKARRGASLERLFPLQLHPSLEDLGHRKCHTCSRTLLREPRLHVTERETELLRVAAIV